MASTTIPRIEAETRERTGSRYAARLRKQGRLPAVIYGHKQDPVHVDLDYRELTDLLHQQVHVIEVENNGAIAPCLVKDVQWCHLGSTILHVDLTRVDLTETVTVEVDLALYGDAVGLKETGAILDHPYAAVHVVCLVSAIPENIRIDVAELAIGDMVTVADLDLPTGVTCTMEPTTILAAVRVLHVEEEEELEPTEPVEGAEPEVIGREKEEGEDEAAGKDGDG